jgi:hypothetical protein
MGRRKGSSSAGMGILIVLGLLLAALGAVYRFIVENAAAIAVFCVVAGYADSRCCDGVFAWSEWMPASMLTGQALFIAHAYMPARPSAVLRSIKDRFVHHHIR